MKEHLLGKTDASDSALSSLSEEGAKLPADTTI